MKIKCRIKTGSKEPAIHTEIINDRTVYVIRTKSRPIENKANIEVVEMLADHFGVLKNSISIVSGHKSRDKIVLIET